MDVTQVLHVLALAFYALAAALLGVSLARSARRLPAAATACLAGGVVAHGAALASFTTEYGELPLVGVGASLSSFAYLIGACLLAASLATESRPLGLVLGLAMALFAVWFSRRPATASGTPGPTSVGRCATPVTPPSASAPSRCWASSARRCAS